MAQVLPGRRPTLLAPGESGPVLIAHGAGNSTRLAQAGISARADFLEVDLWVHTGDFEARHERRFMRPIPLLFERWYIRRAPRQPLRLPELLAIAGNDVGVFLDFKNAVGAAADLVRDAVAQSGCPKRLVASSQHWPTLRALRSRVPTVPVFYSVDVLSKLDLFLSVVRRDGRPAGVSCRHTLLSEPIVERLHELGMEVVAWTVDDPERAEELVRWGVDGITTHRVAELRRHLGLE